MIASLNGTVLAIGDGRIVLEVGGVGYAVAVTPALALSLRLGETVRVHTAMIVRDDDMSLYGFAGTDELAVFDLLRGVTGVGPKSAQGVLAVMTPDQVADAVQAEDDAAFRKVSGIGPKTAKLIVVSLAGKLVSLRPRGSAVRGRPAARGADVLEALIGLGYPERSAQSALDAVLADLPAEQQTAALLRAALQALGPRGAEVVR